MQLFSGKAAHLIGHTFTTLDIYSLHRESAISAVCCVVGCVCSLQNALHCKVTIPQKCMISSTKKVEDSRDSPLGCSQNFFVSLCMSCCSAGKVYARRTARVQERGSPLLSRGQPGMDNVLLLSVMSRKLTIYLKQNLSLFSLISFRSVNCPDACLPWRTSHFRRVIGHFTN